MTRAGLMVEFVLLFVALPLGYRYSPVRIPALPLLWVVAGYAWWQLFRDPRFDRAQLWNAGQLSARLGVILIVFIAVSAPSMAWRSSIRSRAGVQLRPPASGLLGRGHGGLSRGVGLSTRPALPGILL